jgi:hypothetical protein
LSEAALRDQESIAKSYVDLLMQRLCEESELGEAVDMVAWYNVRSPGNTLTFSKLELNKVGTYHAQASQSCN